MTMLLVNSCIAQSVKPDGRQMDKNIEIVAKAFKQWQLGEKSFFDLLADDVEWTVSGRSPVSGIYHGKEDFFKRSLNPITAQFKTPLKPELISLTGDGEYIWLSFHGKATTIDGDNYENTYLWKMQLNNGKIIQGIAFLDTYELTKLMDISNNRVPKNSK